MADLSRPVNKRIHGLLLTVPSDGCQNCYLKLGELKDWTCKDPLTPVCMMPNMWKTFLDSSGKVERLSRPSSCYAVLRSGNPGTNKLMYWCMYE